MLAPRMSVGSATNKSHRHPWLLINVSNKSNENSFIVDIYNMLDQIKEKVSQTSFSSYVAQVTPAVNKTESNIEKRIRVSDCLKDIEVLLDSQFSVDRINNVLSCKTCIPILESKRSLDNKSVPGLFTTKGGSMRNWTLRARLTKHLKSNTHEKCQKQQGELKTSELNISSRNDTLAI